MIKLWRKVISYLEWWWYLVRYWYTKNIYEVYILPKQLREQYTYNGPGMFEREPVWVQYMWQKLGEWGESPAWDFGEVMEDDYRESYREMFGVYPDSDFDDSLYYRFDVTDLERRVWPELKDLGINYVYMYIDDPGFVYSLAYTKIPHTITEIEEDRIIC